MYASSHGNSAIDTERNIMEFFIIETLSDISVQPGTALDIVIGVLDRVSSRPRGIK